ncbi:Aldehyde/histidinol dehydrogenase [Dichomitus squalens]|uniref:Aldehyde/histidinol dehydrogenase n=1 Tax=Dichomitus squalens TaxID=114155 RepID=A0A4Q9M8Y0_9APHY|nr:Aldehyde/histidinol dehydrogenase [Dichomitus squalens]
MSCLRLRRSLDNCKNFSWAERWDTKSIEKFAFTGSTLAGRKITEASAKSNLKKVTLGELGGISLTIVFDDADLEQAVGDPFSPKTFQDPQINQQQHDRIMRYIGYGKADGAKVRYGGHRVCHEGYYISPTIFTETKPNIEIALEEIFGHVCVMGRF